MSLARGISYHSSSKNWASLIIQHPLPNDGKMFLIFGKGRHPHTLQMGIECMSSWNVEYLPLKIG